MPTKREVISSLVGIVLGAAAVLGGFKTDVINLCAKVPAGIAVGDKIGPALSPVDAGQTDAGPMDAGVARASPDASVGAHD